jgi:hypothetical protein
MSTRTATKAQRFQLSFSPAGLTFAEPATITVVLPEDNEVAPTGTLVYDGVPLARMPTVPNTLRANLRGFAEARFFALAFRAAPPVLPNTSPQPMPCADTDVGEFVLEALTASDEVPISLYAYCARQGVWSAHYTGSFAHAVRLADATDAYLQRVELGASSAQLAEFRTYSCTVFTNVVQALQDSTVGVFGYLPRYVNRVRDLARHVQRVGVACPALNTYEAAIDARVAQALEFFATRVGLVNSTSSVDFESALQDAWLLERVIADLRTLGADSAAIAHATDVARERAHPVLLQVLIPAAYAACRDGGNTIPIARLARIVGPVPVLRTAVVYCRTRLVVQSRDSAGALVDQLASPLGGTPSPYAPIVYDTIDVRLDGRLVLLGPVFRLTCRYGDIAWTESLTMRLGGVTTNVYSSPPYFAPFIEFPIATLRTAAGIAPGDLGDKLLTFSRDDGACGGWWGPQQAPLLSLLVRFQP